MHDPKNLTVLFSYTESVVPPRCRKARPVKFHDGEFSFAVPHLEGNEAPVAIISTGHIGYGDQERRFGVEYRWFSERLWTAVRLDGVRPSGYTSRTDDWEHPPLPETIDARSDSASASLHGLGLHYGTYRTRAEAEEELRACLEDHLVVDGAWYRPAGEPRYVVQTFGLGANHGGTALFATDHFNTNLGQDCYYNLLAFEAAVAHATRTAQSRGDTQSLPIRVNGGETFRILQRSALKVQSPPSDRLAEKKDEGRRRIADIRAVHTQTLLGLVQEASVPGGIGPHEFSRAGGWLQRAQSVLAKIDLEEQ